MTLLWPVCRPFQLVPTAFAPNWFARTVDGGTFAKFEQIPPVAGFFFLQFFYPPSQHSLIDSPRLVRSKDYLQTTPTIFRKSQVLAAMSFHYGSSDNYNPAENHDWKNACTTGRTIADDPTGLETLTPLAESRNPSNGTLLRLRSSCEENHHNEDDSSTVRTTPC